MTANTELQRLMNDVQNQNGLGKIVAINGHQVRCIGVLHGRTSKLLFALIWTVSAPRSQRFTRQ